MKTMCDTASEGETNVHMIQPLLVIYHIRRGWKNCVQGLEGLYEEGMRNSHGEIVGDFGGKYTTSFLD